jgi:hypothetical protein
VADMQQIRNECRSQIYYNNFLTVPDRVLNFRPSLLVNLYRRLLMWKSDSRGTSEERVSSRKIRAYQGKTLLFFLFRTPLPFRRKIRWLLKLNAPGLLKSVDKTGLSQLWNRKILDGSDS